MALAFWPEHTAHRSVDGVNADAELRGKQSSADAFAPQYANFSRLILRDDSAIPSLARGVLPGVTAVDVRHSGRRDPELPSDGSATFSTGETFPDLLHIDFAELGAPDSRARYAATFLDHIVGIHFGRAQEQMPGIHADRIVAGVAGQKSIRNIACVDQIGQSARSVISGPVVANLDPQHSVAVVIGVSGPRPTRLRVRRLINSLKETSEKIVRYSGHVNLLNRLAVPGALQRCPAFRCSNYTAQSTLSPLFTGI